jgi:hypothetical protein
VGLARLSAVEFRALNHLSPHAAARWEKEWGHVIVIEKPANALATNIGQEHWSNETGPAISPSEDGHVR